MAQKKTSPAQRRAFRASVVRLMERLDLSQVSGARLLGISRKHLNRILNNPDTEVSPLLERVVTLFSLLSSETIEDYFL